MDRIVITAYFGGEWRLLDGSWNFIDEQVCKAIVLEKGVTFQELSALLIKRFCVDTNAFRIRITHPNSHVSSSRPCDINGTDDMEAYFFINEKSATPWSVPLYVSLEPIIGANEEKMMGKADFINPRTTKTTKFDRATSSTNMSGEGSLDFSEQNEVVPNMVDLEPFFSEWFIRKKQSYSSKKELRNALVLHATWHCYQFRIKKSNNLLLVAVCIDTECKWRVRATKLKNSKLFNITKYIDEHTCSFETRRTHQREASCQLITSKIKSMFEGVKQTPTPKQIMGVMRNLYNIKANYKKCWRAKEGALELTRGTAEKNYAKLPSYFYMLHKVNPGSIVNLVLYPNRKFRYAFVSFGASIKGYQYMRKVITVDGTFLKAKYKGVLLTAVAQDANMQIFSLAFAVVDSENDNSWSYFFQQLRLFVPDYGEQVFVSDRHASIKKVVKSHFGNSYHGVCTFHLKQNIKTRCRVKRIQEMFTEAATSYKQTDFDDIFAQILHEKPKIALYLEKADKAAWSRAYFPSKRYNIMTSNNAESLNSRLVDAREYTMMSLFDEIRILLSTWFHERRQHASSYKDKATPEVQEIMQKKYHEARRLVCRPIHEGMRLFEVCGDKTNVVVNLGGKTCTCQEFDMEEIPCVHAIAAALYIKVDISSLVGQYYTTSNWRKGYEEVIYPVPDMKEWVAPDMGPCRVPDVRVMSGRKQKTRIPSVGEFKKRKCKNCGKVGHNKKTCTNKPL